jgi:hypothetical protein
LTLNHSISFIQHLPLRSSRQPSIFDSCPHPLLAPLQPTHRQLNAKTLSSPLSCPPLPFLPPATSSSSASPTEPPSRLEGASSLPALTFTRTYLDTSPLLHLLLLGKGENQQGRGEKTRLTLPLPSSSPLSALAVMPASNPISCPLSITPIPAPLRSVPSQRPCPPTAKPSSTPSSRWPSLTALTVESLLVQVSVRSRLLISSSMAYGPSLSLLLTFIISSPSFLPSPPSPLLRLYPLHTLSACRFASYTYSLHHVSPSFSLL